MKKYQGGMKYWSREFNWQSRGYLPMIGLITIAINDFPLLKIAFIGTLAFLFQKGNKGTFLARPSQTFGEE